VTDVPSLGASRRPIAVVQGADGAVIQRLLGDVAAAPWCPSGVAGIIELPKSDDPGCGRAMLRNIRSGATFSLFQDLGAGSTACALDPGGVTEACAAVCRDIAAGCDLVLLSKFGKLEAETGGGLLAAFVAAIEADVPVLTAVSPYNMDRWDTFAAPFYEVIGASQAEIAAWWAAQRPAAASSATT
jgi:hypothetical protein